MTLHLPPHLSAHWSVVGGLRGRSTAASPYTAEADAYFAALSVQPDDTRKALIDDLIGDLKDGGLWSLLDGLWLFAAHDTQASRVNLVTPGTYTMTAINSPTFTVDRGWAGNGTNAYLLSGANWNALAHYALDSAHLGAWVRAGTDAAGGSAALGTFSVASSSTLLRPRGAGNVIQANVNNATALNLGTVATIIGHTLAVRRASNDVEGYRNGASLGTSTTASTALEAAQMCTHSRNMANFSTFQLSAVHIGAALSDAQAGAFYTILSTYLTAVGA